MKKQQEIENSINYLTCVINKLKTKINDNADYNVAYNRLLIKRAELRKKLHYNNTPAGTVINLFKENFKCFRSKSREKLICDYFNSIKL